MRTSTLNLIAMALLLVCGCNAFRPNGISEIKTTYDRTAALDYAKRFWSKVNSDGYIAVKGNPAYVACPAGTPFQQIYAGGSVDEWATLPNGSIIGWDQGLNDCAHFVSSCLGTPPGDKGGGLPISSQFNTIYGQTSAHKLFVDLKSKNLVTVLFEDRTYNDAEPMLTSLQPGDLIFYHNKDYKEYQHCAIYLGGTERRITCHSYCRHEMSNAYPQGWDSVMISGGTSIEINRTLGLREDQRCTFVRIN